MPTRRGPNDFRRVIVEELKPEENLNEESVSLGEPEMESPEMEEPLSRPEEESAE